MISTQNQQNLVVTSALARLLKERGMTQKEFARRTGISEKAISRIKNRKIIHRIDCAAAVRICLTLSELPRRRDGRIKSIRLDMLFPMVSAPGRTYS
jgi:DNA-binding Xre family transcriptional regulator